MSLYLTVSVLLHGLVSGHTTVICQNSSPTKWGLTQTCMYTLEMAVLKSIYNQFFSSNKKDNEFLFEPLFSPYIARFTGCSLHGLAIMMVRVLSCAQVICEKTYTCFQKVDGFPSGSQMTFYQSQWLFQILGKQSGKSGKNIINLRGQSVK